MVPNSLVVLFACSYSTSIVMSRTGDPCPTASSDTLPASPAAMSIQASSMSPRNMNMSTLHEFTTSTVASENDREVSLAVTGRDDTMEAGYSD